MAARVLVLAGLNLDKGWPHESPGVGPLLRAASSDLLVQIASRALESDVDALVILGGLWDPSSVRSSTVDEVEAVLGAMPFPVVVIPDVSEARLQHRPQQLVEWPASVRWIGSAEICTLEIAGTRFQFAGPSAPALPADGAALAFTTTAHPLPAELPVVAPEGASPDAAPPVLGVPLLVTGTGAGTPRALVLTWSDDGGLEAADLDFDATLGERRTIDLSTHEDAVTLVAELDDLLVRSAPLGRVVVTGRVGPRLVIPPALDWRPAREDVTIVWQDLTYVFPSVTPGSHTVAAELVRRLSGAGPDEARRHQALAVALNSLDGAYAS